MFLTLAVTVVIAVTAFFGTSPRVSNPRAVLAFNVAVMALSIPVALAVGMWLYSDAVTVKSDVKGLATFLAIMAGSCAALIVVSVGGLVRNFVLFPRSKRLPLARPGAD
jgi:hypothetical protein